MVRLTVGLAVATVLLVAVVSTSGSVPLATEGAQRGNVERVPSFDEPPEAGAAELPQPSRAGEDTGGDSTLVVLGQTLALLLVLAVGVVAVRTLLAWPRVTRQRAEPPPPEHWPQPVDLVEAVDDSLVALRAGPVDEVIVACWVRLEDAAAAAGVVRRPDETSAELASRVLADLRAPDDAVDALLQRYRQARYSHHVLDEDDRAVAVRSLEEIRAAIAGANA